MSVGSASNGIKRHLTPDHLCLLASALAGREIRVETFETDAPAWTNGSVIFVSIYVDYRVQLAQVCVQAALLAAGSLDPGVIRPLLHRPDLSRRYLAIEGQRAITVLRNLLPGFILRLSEGQKSDSESPQASMQEAKARALCCAPPETYGCIKVRELLASQYRAPGATADEQHQPRSQAKSRLTELTDDEPGDTQEQQDDASSPVGGGGGIGRLLQKMLQMVRNVKSGGSPGADTPTHWSRTGSRAGARAVTSSATAETIEDLLGMRGCALYPEWNVHDHCYRQDWCSVEETEAPRDISAAVEWLEGYGLRRPISRLGLGLDRFRHQSQGDDIDIDAIIDAQVEIASGSYPDEAVYIESQRHRRDLSVMILLDISGSVAQASTNGMSIHEAQRRLAAELLTVLYELGDRTALFAFHSQGRNQVSLIPVKRFEELLNGVVMERLYSLKPGAYSRLGAAIRHGSQVLSDQGGTAKKLLLVLSDGLAYDHGYEPAYAAADVRKSLAEARHLGIGSLCLNLGSSTDAYVLERVFGSACYASISSARELARLIGPLFRSALQSADLSKNVA